MSDGRTDLSHKQAAPRRVGFFTVTVSDTRTADDDVSGACMRDLIAQAGHDCVAHCIVLDEPARVVEAIAAAVSRDDVQIVVLSGGTGLSSRDGTFEAVSALIEKPMPGFGEIFRMLSFEQVGAAAMLSRATAGLYRGRAVFALPGSPKAVSLALSRLILPEAGHLVFESRR
ncbi:MAG: MogA/MoaB family molybdenum cofactor biosynthesis protein [Proteobacteria bacterium]|nr:MogA/MoaB family molybdenum cofactor biosynthesis protein [Pseudomonadota bacterium]